MRSREAACDPCRTAKLGCDHRRPVCTRCRQSNKALACVYRASPFRRKRVNNSDVPIDSQTQGNPVGNPLPPKAPSRRKVYPNPGHLGSSSHAAIFNHIDLDGNTLQERPSSPTPATQCSPTPCADLHPKANEGAEMLKEVLNKFDLDSMKDLVYFWLAKGVNLALAEPFVRKCAETIDYITTNIFPNNENRHHALATHLLRNSDRPLTYDRVSTLDSFTDQFCGQNVRWETLGIFLQAVIRATFDIPFFPSLYIDESGRHSIQTALTKLSAYSLELCLSLDCLSDLQLIFQYENFIVRSYVDGDQSFSSWRSLGEVIASAFALGYHENIQTKPDVPQFLIELRSTAFARIYSADKNVAIFLGRPPRMCKRFCSFQIPSSIGNPAIGTSGPLNRPHLQDWDLDAEMNYRSETRWSALCASLKEDILELLLSQDRTYDPQRASDIINRAKAQWEALPTHFRLCGSLRHCSQSPFERDFLVSTRLNYLHVQFLLRLALLSNLTEPDNEIVEISQKMLAIVVETILFRDHLANSGTGLIWKIEHYGLPSAGIILLSMLKQHRTSNAAKSSHIQLWQDLSILVAEVQRGSIVRLGEPNYSILFKATQTIQRFLEFINLQEEVPSLNAPIEQQQPCNIEEWFLDLNPDPWNLEIGFWDNLAEHPFLSNAESNVNTTFMD